MTMEAVFQIVSNIKYYSYQYWFDVQDPRTKDFPLINRTPWPLFLIMFSYYLLATKVIPYFMKDRKEYQLRKIMFVYNIIMVGINLWAFDKVIKAIGYGERLWMFEYPSRDDFSSKVLLELNQGFIIWLSKFLDLFDTIFFALRKKESQITFLHLYHHISVPILGWLAFKINATVPAGLLFVLMNSLIHVIMYSYYALASFGPKIQKYLWWKKHITQMQLGQFLVLGLYGVVLFFKQTGYPLNWFYFSLTQPPFFFYMFYDFYRKSYKKEKYH